MKKLLVFVFIICSFKGFSQTPYPTPYQNLGSKNTYVQSWALGIDTTFKMPVFYDTTAANLTRAKLYSGALIYTRVDTSFYVRNITATKWLQISGSGGGSSGTPDTIISGTPLYVRIAAETGADNDSIKIKYGDSILIYAHLTGSNLVLERMDGDSVVIALPGGGTTETASNGNVKIGNDIQWGGPLTSSPTIAVNTFTLNMSTSTSNDVLNITGTSGNGVLSTVTSGSGLKGVSDVSSGVGVWGIGRTGVVGTTTNTAGVGIGAVNSSTSSGAVALNVLSNGDNAATLTSDLINSNSVLPVVRIKRSVSGGSAGANGIGNEIAFETETDLNNNIVNSNSIISKWTNAANASRTSEFSIIGVGNTFPKVLLTLAGNGVGAFYKGANVASGTTITATGNLFHVTGTTTITSVSGTDITAGSTITIIFDGVLTFTDGSNLKLNGDFVTTADDTITLTNDGTNFYEITRSNN